MYRFGVRSVHSGASHAKRSLEGKIALITGSTGGIGLGIARALARQGCNVMLNGFGDEKMINEMKEEISSKHKVQVHFNGADLSVPQQCENLIQATEYEFGRVDILVNNAGVQHVGPIDHFPLEKYNQIMAINAAAPFHLTRSALPHMKKHNFGRIINIASVHGLVASVNKAPYVMSKHAVIGLTKATALETASFNITCNAICPGWVLTPLVQKQIDLKAATEHISVDTAREKLLSEKQPKHEFVSPDNLGELAVFLCSDAAKAMTGAALPMDGAWTAH
eukprot:GILI01010139.1.p1 GENE.GILI01010139.1~~GILI01010139.1.p1  ORF type:complete len:296 (+),score=76.88 GILI01010139.1:54-890(+)